MTIFFLLTTFFYYFSVGNFINDERNVVSMARMCNMLPFGGVDACQQSTVLGVRVVTCSCFSDYCNSTITTRTSTVLMIFLVCVLWFIR